MKKEVRILEIKESVFADNDRQADMLRQELKEKGVLTEKHTYVTFASNEADNA